MEVGQFALVDHRHRAVSIQDYLGKHVLVFFGFTHCKVVCPRALGRMSRVLDALGPAADEIQSLYVSVDPDRDTPDVMRAFLELDYPRFTGLTGTREQVDAAKKAFHVFAEARPDPTAPDGYVVPHTSITYLLDRQGRYAAHFAEHLDDLTVTERLRALIQN
jgi:protein SCO1/2